jgi:hypothetical protein
MNLAPFLPVWLLGAPLVIAIIDLMGTRKSNSHSTGAQPRV